MSEQTPFPGWYVISRYTRADMLTDGSLIEVPASTAFRFGFRAPLAITRAVYLAVIWDHAATGKDHDTGREFTPHEKTMLAGLLHTAVLELARLTGTGRLHKNADRITFTYRDQKVIFHIGPGDNGEAVFTIMTREDA
jgi:hypothetical protein